MALIKSDIDFMSARKRRMTSIFSAILLSISVFSLIFFRFEFGLDFTSGTLIEVAYEEAVPPETIRQQLVDAGFEQAVVVTFGSDRDILVRLPVEGAAEDLEAASAASTLGDEVLAVLRDDDTVAVEMRRSEFVGPKVGEELVEKGILAVMAALAIMMVYMGLRFQYKFGIAAVMAQAHDVIVVLGAISLLGLTFDLTVLAALLAVLGYTLNDTIVVFDRARENFRTLRITDTEKILNITLNQVVARSVVTSLTTLLALGSMLLMGGEGIKAFAISMMVGVVVGTYTSLHISCNFLIYLKVGKEDLMIPVKEGEQEGAMP